MPSLTRALAAVLAAGALAPAAAHAQQAVPLPTPGLIDEALEAGKISSDRATILRAQALSGDPALPEAYRSDVPWEGTTTMLAVQDGLADLSPAQRRTARRAWASAANDTSCGASSTGPLDDRLDSAHFRIDASAVGGGLAATDYRDALETAYAKQVGESGWAAPATAPGTGGRVHVRLSPLAGGLLGYVTTDGTHAAFVGDNPSTAWDDQTAYAGCMVLRSDYAGLGGGTTPAGLLSSTTAHELNHALQMGYGALGDDIRPDPSMFESGAVLIEQDSQDDDTALFRVPPYPDESLGGFPDWADQYSMFYVLRGMMERFGVGVAGGEEQVMQDFWELLGKRQHGGQMGALQQAFALRGTTAGAEFHNYAIAAKHLAPCGVPGGFPAGRCFADAAIYRTKPRVLQPSRGGHGAAQASAPWSGAVKDDLALNWVQLPWSASAYDVELANTSQGGALRASAVCEEGAGLRVLGTIAPVGPGQATTVTLDDPAPCTTRPFLVVTNEATIAGNPDVSAERAYTVSVSGDKRAVRMRATTQGGGTGTATLTPSEGVPVTCTPSCTTDFEPGTEVTLTATPDGTDLFLGFSGGGCAGTDPCTLTMDRAHEVRVGFAPEDAYDFDHFRVFPASNNLDILSDTGQVLYDDGNGGAPCEKAPMCWTDTLRHGTPFTLTARANISEGQRQTYAGWQGYGAEDCVDTERSCTFEVTANPSAARNTIYAIAQTEGRLTVEVTGQGRIGINLDFDGVPDLWCPEACSAWVSETVGPGLYAEPAPGWRFVGWGEGDCEIVLPTRCGVGAMSEPRTVRAVFERAPTHQLTVTKTGAGSGTVTSSPAAISCGSTCSADVVEGTEVTLTATAADAGSTFTGWSGACSGSAESCTVTMSEARAVTATFAVTPRHTLSVTTSGTGSGRVWTALETGIDCGVDCTQDYLTGTVVTLVANPAAGSTFAGWGGACAGETGAVCTLTMSAARSVTASFPLQVVPDPDPDPTPDPTPDSTPDPTPDPTPDVGVPAPKPPVLGGVTPIPPFTPGTPTTPPPSHLAKVTVPRQSMAKVVGKGLRLTLTAAVPSKVTATLSVDKKVAKKLRLRVKGGRATAGSGKGTAGPKGGTLKVKLTGKAVKAAKKLRSFPALLTLTTTAPGAAPEVTKRPVTIGR